MTIWAPVIVTVVAIGVILFRVMRAKNVDLILRYSLTKGKEGHEGLRHIFFCLADHFEPYWGTTNEELAKRRVENWLKNYPTVIDGFRDNSGRPPQHSFFYPAEEYDARCVDMLSQLQRRGYGSVEIHLHHEKDTSEGLRHKLLEFKNVLNKEHGLLQRNAVTGEVEYGFIHGMYALDDSGPGGRWCGVRDEITILKETGCYADFTFPSAPASTQPPVMNRIYYVKDDPIRPKSHHKGVDAEYGKSPSGDLLLVNGPLAINWRQRRKIIFPAIENGALTGNNFPTPDRVDLWVRVGIAVKGWPNWVFIKIHTHGTQEAVSSLLLKDGLRSLYSDLLDRYNDGRCFVLHFVRPREIYHCVKALESGNPAWIKKIEEFDYAPPLTGGQ